MKKFFLAPFLFCLATICFGQKAKLPAAPVTTKPKTAVVKKNTPPRSLPVKPTAIESQIISEISAAEWQTLADSLLAENWETGVSQSTEFISRFKVDNEKKQLAQLRYLYLYTLAGKILKAAAAKNPAQENAVWEELKRAAARFTGKEFLLPPRQFLGNCRQAFNYICTVTDDDRALRSVATDKNATRIHSFDYVVFDKKIAFKEFKENKTFLGGNLRKVEFNDDLSKLWVMRLIFDKGFVRIII